jgi:hypothetical protein
VNKYYKFHRNKQTWFGARKVCQDEQATLALPENLEEANVMLKYFNDKYPASKLSDIVHKDYLLIGFHDFFNEGEYVSLKGEQKLKIN